jgi:A/G-specific adenine glycosylase
MEDVEHLRQSLLGWYDTHARTLPWRSEPTPYHVLLSELMCQQTRIDTVLPYFAKFTQRWPTLEALASASEEEVVEAWAGLGYYRRARFLHRAARAAVEVGGLPADVAGLRALPGVGPYTAGAIASIAFNIATPLVDGNVERVLSRLDDRDADPRSTTGRKALWARAAALVDPARPGDFNQALMELGAMVCSPRAPDCPSCPWRAACAGSYRAEELPKKPKRKPPTRIAEVAAVAWDGDRILVGRRPPGGLLGGLWEPPRAAPQADETPWACAERAVREAVGRDCRAVGSLGTITHVFSHRHLTLSLVGVIVEPGPLTPGTYDRVGFYVPDAVALSRLGSKAVEGGRAAPQLLLAAESEHREYTAGVEDG